MVHRGQLETSTRGPAWVLDFRSERPFHPQRLNDAIELLGGGSRRTRGCFWLPSRPMQTCRWDGAGGQLSIGRFASWGQAQPLTRTVTVGLDKGQAQLKDAFRSCLLTDEELDARGQYWEVDHDGFEPWLGPVRTTNEE